MGKYNPRPLVYLFSLWAVNWYWIMLMIDTGYSILVQLLRFLWRVLHWAWICKYGHWSAILNSLQCIVHCLVLKVNPLISSKVCLCLSDSSLWNHGRILNECPISALKYLLLGTNGRRWGQSCIIIRNNKILTLIMGVL